MSLLEPLSRPVRQRRGVRVALVAQRVESGGDDEGRRQAGQVGGPGG